MTRSEITEKLKYILSTADDRDPERYSNVTEETRLMEDLGMSSVGMLYIVIAIEEEFGIRFDNVGASDFKTLRDVLDYIEAKLS